MVAVLTAYYHIDNQPVAQLNKISAVYKMTTNTDYLFKCNHKNTTQNVTQVN